MNTARTLQINLQQATGVNVSDQSIRDKLLEGGLSFSRPYAHCPVPLSPAGICHKISEMAAPPLAPFVFHTSEQVQLSTCDRCKNLEKLWRTLCCL